MKPTTLSQKLFDFLFKDLGVSDGKEFFLYSLPDTRITDTNVFWLVPNVETLSQKNFTSEPRYLDTFTLNYRSSVAKYADEELSRVKEIINKLKCIKLPHYNVVSIQATTIQVDNDIDTEKAKRASLIINLQTYNERKEDEQRA